MCGRYALAFSNEEVYDALENQLPRMFERARPRWEREQDYRGGNFNVAPRQRMPIIHRDPEDGEQAMLHTAQWGLIPHWTKHPPTAPLNTINARSESLLEAGSGGMWHALKGYRRCVIPAQGYYEWQKKSSTKIPHFTRLPDHSKSASQPTSSSLYDIVKYASPVESRFKPSSDPSDKREPYPTGNPLPLCTYTILTTSPPAEFAWLHDRMPCVLNGWEEVRAWLDLGEEEGGWVEGKEGTGRLLRGRSGLECYPVPPEVGKVGTNSPTFIQPVSERADGIKSFFQKQTGASPAKKSIIPKSEIKDDKAGTTRGVKRERSADTKSDIKEEGQDRKRRRSSSSIIEGKREGEEEEIKTVIKDEEGKEDPEPGLGVDSNAPAPKDEKGNEKDKEETPKRKRGGHEIKVTRKPEEVKSDQSSITSFFASPAKPEKSTTSSAPRGAASSKEGGAKRKTRSSR